MQSALPPFSAPHKVRAWDVVRTGWVVTSKNESAPAGDKSRVAKKRGKW